MADKRSQRLNCVIVPSITAIFFFAGEFGVKFYVRNHCFATHLSSGPAGARPPAWGGGVGMLGPALSGALHASLPSPNAHIHPPLIWGIAPFRTVVLLLPCFPLGCAHLPCLSNALSPSKGAGPLQPRGDPHFFHPGEVKLGGGVPSPLRPVSDGRRPTVGAARCRGHRPGPPQDRDPPRRRSPVGGKG